jgi:UDP-N-acetylmuramoyl-tripeptide--D-alanyl-D-alanine ligase
MAVGIPLTQLTEILSAQPLHLPTDGENAIAGVTTDSRAVQPGELFVALRGDRFDGHGFVESALQQGAIAAVVDQPIESLPDAPLLVVPDTLAAYQALGRWWRQQFQIPVIAVTGSVGKTTTKELIAAVLSTQGTVLKTQANFNNEIGVPKTLLELRDRHDFAVIEMGMRASGEIADLTRIACPDIAVITNVGTAHIGRLGSEQAIANAKCELLAELDKTGVAILNHDCDRLIETANRVWAGKTVTYGLDAGDISGEWIAPDTLQMGKISLPLPLPGRHNALNYLAALAVAQQVGIEWAWLQSGVMVSLPQGRSQRISLPNDIMILDETYNAGVESMTAALQLLADTPGQRHIAMLGTMKELGERSPDLHLQVGKTVEKLELNYLLILADPAEAEALASGAGSVPYHICQSHAEAIAFLSDFIQAGDRILLKASRAVGLDQVVNGLVKGLG